VIQSWLRRRTRSAVSSGEVRADAAGGTICSGVLDDACRRATDHRFTTRSSVTTIIGICGSLRSQSYNLMLLRAAAALVPDGTTIELASLRDIPLYDGDVEARDGVPLPVQHLKNRIADSAGVLIATPEYNNSIPGVAKNAIDWLSRPPADIARVFRGKPIALMGASPGQFGTTLSQAAWLPVLRTLGTAPWFEARMLVANAGKVFDETGAITDASVQQRLATFVSGFAAFVDARAR
jgi:NAD(P)H-dependent FMN reductase